jgi:VWFA-related protein
VDALDRIVGADDLFGVMTQDMRPQDLTLGRRLLTVEDQLSRHWTWGERARLANTRDSVGENALTSCFHFLSDGTPWTIDDNGRQRAVDEILIERRREDEVLASLQDLMTYLARQRDARTALLVLTDGWVLHPADRVLANVLHQDDANRGASMPYPGEPPISGGGARAPRPLRPGEASVSSGPGDGNASFASCLAEGTRIAQLDAPLRFHDIVAEASRLNVSFYPVALSQLAVFDSDLSRQPPDFLADQAQGLLAARAQNLKTMAEETGGVAVVGTNDLAGGLRHIADDLSAYYLLGYYSTNTKLDGRLRTIDVRMKQPGLTVHARRSYRASATPDDAAIAGAGSAASAVPVDEALGVLARLRPTSDVFLHGARRGSDLIVAVELSSGDAARSDWTERGEVSVQVTDANGQRVGEMTAAMEPRTRGAIVRVPVGTAAMGPWRLAARVTRGRDSVSDTGEVRPGSGRIVGDPLLFRGTSSPRAPLNPAADFQFRRTERVHVEWSILQPLDQRTARLLDRQGQPLPLPVALTEGDVDGQPVVAADLLLAPLADGDSVIELVAGSGGTSERALVPIRVAR